MPRAYQGAKTRTYQKLYGYKNLITWQKADDLAAMVHELTLHWGPGYYRLSDQMRSAAVSVKSNIAEGYCRVSLGDYIRFCVIARGSLGERGSQIQDCERWGHDVFPGAPDRRTEEETASRRLGQELGRQGSRSKLRCPRCGPSI